MTTTIQMLAIRFIGNKIRALPCEITQNILKCILYRKKKKKRQTTRYFDKIEFINCAVNSVIIDYQMINLLKKKNNIILNIFVKGRHNLKSGMLILISGLLCGTSGQSKYRYLSVNGTEPV